MKTHLRPAHRFLVGGFILAGFLSALAIPIAHGADRRDISSLSQLAAPELSQAIQNAGKNPLLYVPPADVPKQAKTEKIRSGLSLPVYSNSFPPMIAQVRTQNWDQ